MRLRSPLVFLALTLMGALHVGCSRSSSSNNNHESPAASAAPLGPLLADFGSTDPALWVNGAPTSLAAARGNVVLIEAWDRS